MKLIIIGCSLTFFAACGSSVATSNRPRESEGFTNPNLGLILGRGVDPTRPLSPRGDCLQGVDLATEISWKDAQGIKGRFTETKIQTMEALHQELSLSAHLAAEALWGGGEASFAKYEKFRQDKEAFTWLVDYTVEVGSKTLNGHRLTLTPKAQALVDAGNIEAFYEMCGTEYVRSVQLGGKFTAVFEIESKHSELVRKISATFEAYARLGTWGFSGGGQINSFLQDAYSKSLLKKEIVQWGGKTIDIEHIGPNHLSRYLLNLQNELNATNAVPIRIETASWSTLGVQDVNTFAHWHRKSTLDYLYNLYRHDLQLLQNIIYIYDQHNDGHLQLTPKDQNALNTLHIDLTQQLPVIAQHAKACIEEGICKAPELPRHVLPDLSVEATWSQQALGEWLIYTPRSWKSSSRQINLEDRVALSFTLPDATHAIKDVSDLRILFYEVPCTSPNLYLEAIETELQQQGVVVRRTPHALSLQWSRYASLHESLNLLAKTSSTGACLVTKLHHTGSRALLPEDLSFQIRASMF
jgi:hypothetical protein